MTITTDIHLVPPAIPLRERIRSLATMLMVRLGHGSDAESEREFRTVMAEHSNLISSICFSFSGNGVSFEDAGVRHPLLVGDVDLPVDKSAQKVAFAKLKYAHRAPGGLHRRFV